MAAKNLYEFYTGKGQKLPSIQERSKLYESYGLGQAGTYGGTEEQNTALLGKLSSQGGGTSVGTQGGTQQGLTPMAIIDKYIKPPAITPTAPTQLPPIQTDVGGLVVKERQRVGMPIDALTIKSDYRKYGLDQKYGDWRGSAEQWKALGIEDVGASFKAIQDKINKEGIQNEQRQNVIEPGAMGSPSTGGEVNSTYEYTEMGDSDYQSVMDDVVSSIGTTDITKLIQDFAGGDISTPEMELSKEDRDAKLDELKTAAAQGLSKLQQGLAAKGMTFSGIRTTQEANLAADVLAKEAGIGREFAGKIINAARQEQGRRETALKTAETGYNKALEAQGYVYNPFTNTITKTLAREQFEQKPTTKTFSSGGGYYSYDPATGEVAELVSPTQKTPQTLTTSQGIMEWNPDTGQWEPTGFYAKSGSDTPTESEKEQSNIQNFRSQLNAVSGDDEHVSESDWQKYKKQWLDKGLDEDDFIKNFSDKINPDFADSYGMKESEYSQEYTFSTDLQIAIAEATNKKSAKAAQANLTKAYPTKANIIQAAFDNLGF